MVMREYRRYTPEEKERLSRRACPHCGRERVTFNPENEHTICCQPSCSMEYWFKQRPTISGMRRLVRDEQKGKCARCGQEVHEFNATEGPDNHHHYILDHIRPIAMGGDQWARDNLQVLCEKCNKIKTARDMGTIARWKKYHGRGLTLPEHNSRQVLLFLRETYGMVGVSPEPGCSAGRYNQWLTALRDHHQQSMNCPAHECEIAAGNTRVSLLDDFR